MLAVDLLQRGGWRFDLPSALIGAAVAWLIAALLYARRKQIKQLKGKLLTPLQTWRQELRSGQSQRYLKALQEKLRGLLLFEPQEPVAIFQPPTLLGLPPLPSSKETGIGQDKLPDLQEIPFSSLLKGHPYLLIIGPRASGRTTALAMLTWENAAQATTVAQAQEQQDKQGKNEEVPPERLPLWIDLAQLRDLPSDTESTPLERLVELAVHFLPGAAPKWLTIQLEKSPSLILVDNWEELTRDEQSIVAVWIAELQAQLPQSRWVIACGPRSYGHLVEAGFVALELQRPTGEAMLQSLYAGWASRSEIEDAPPPDEALLHILRWADQAGASIIELTLRIRLYLQTQRVPERFADVIDHLLDERIPLLEINEDEALAAEARMLTLKTLAHIAQARRLDGRILGRDEVKTYITSQLPAEEENAVKIERAVRKLLKTSGLLAREGKSWVLNHYVWEDFLTAWTLTQHDWGVDMTRTHLQDPTWRLVLEFYAGLGDAGHLIETLRNRVKLSEAWDELLRMARWSIVAPPDMPWRRQVMRALAENILTPGIDAALRLQLARALALVAGESVRGFFIKALRSPQPAIRCVGLRGLGWVGSSREMKVLTGALRDANEEIRQSAVQALAEMSTEGAIKVLAQRLYEADEHLMLTIAEKLTATPEGREALREAAQAEDLMVRRAAAHGLEFVPQPWADDVLERLVRDDPQWLVRAAADAALKARARQGQAPPPIPTPPPEIDKLDWLITWAAQQGSGLGVGAAALDMLVRATIEGKVGIQLLGAMTLRQIGQKQHIETLRGLLEHKDARVQAIAADAIHRIEERYHDPQESGITS